MKTIVIEMDEWLKNAGIVGLYNILEHAGHTVELGSNAIKFNVSYLENFEEKYYGYFKDTYKDTMIYSEVIKRLQYMIHNSEDKVDHKEYEKEIEYVKGKLNNSAYKDVKSSIAMRELNKPTLEFLKQLLEKINSQKDIILQKETIGYYDQKAGISKSPNAVIDKYINTNMLRLDELTKEVVDYRIHDISKKKKAFQCFTCGNEINKIERGLSFLNNMYFDTARKTSHVWDFTSDIEICPICKLTYFCVPAGFTTVYGKGVYINVTTDMKAAIDTNMSLKMNVLKQLDLGKNLTYKALVNAISERRNKSVVYELADIQVVRCEDNNYWFNILSKRVLKSLLHSQQELDSIIDIGFYIKKDDKSAEGFAISCGFSQQSNFYSIYSLVVKKLLNSENLFILIHKLLIAKLYIPDACRFNERQLLAVQKINYNFLEGIEQMSKENKKIIEQAKNFGYYLKLSYKEKSAENKLSGISYRLLNALKTNNKDMFMDTLLNCYLYTKKEVPYIFLDTLKSTEDFKTIGYAFVTGLIDGGSTTNKDNGGEK